MTVLSKQYSLVDLINLRLRDDDNDKRVASAFNIRDMVFKELYDIAKNYPNILWWDFMKRQRQAKIFDKDMTC